MIFKRINDNPRVIKGLKIAAISIGSFFAVLYVCFLLILPNVINLNSYIPQISSEVKKATGLSFNAKKPKLKTTPKLGIAVIAENVTLKYKNGSDFLSIDNPNIEINLPTLIFGHLNLDRIYAKNININLVFGKDKKYTIEDYILNSMPKQTDSAHSAQELPFEIRNISAKADNITLLLKDENTNKSYITSAQNTRIDMPSIKGPLKFQTKGAALDESTGKKIADFNVSLQTKISDFQEQDKNRQNNTQQFKFDFNPFDKLSSLSGGCSLNVNLKIADFAPNFKASGAINFINEPLKQQGKGIPYILANVIFKNTAFNPDITIKFSENESLKIIGEIKSGKKSKIDLSAKCEKVQLASIKNLTRTIFDAAGIKNELAHSAADGFIVCDFNIKSDFKTIRSNGNLKLNEGGIKYSKLGLNLTEISSYIDFNNNTITIKDTNALVNGSKFDVSGTIQPNSKLNIKVNSDPIKIADLIKLGTQFGIIKIADIKDYAFSGGDVVLNAAIGGDLKNIVPKADVQINKPALTIKSLKMPVNIEKISITAEPDKKDKKEFSAKINAKNFKAAMQNPALNISAADCSISANSKDLTILPFTFTLQGSNASIAGTVKDYTTNPQTDIKISGKIHPSTVLAFVPKQNRSLVTYKGQMPFSAAVTGTLDELKIMTDVTSDAQNFVSIADIKNIRSLKNTLVADLVLKNDTLIINGINLNSKGAKIASLGGRIANIYSKNPVLTPLNVVIAQKLSLALPSLGKLSFDTDANLAINGTALKPQITGNANISNLNYPEFQASVNTAFLDFKKSSLNARAEGIKVAGSDFSGDAVLLTDFSKGFVVNSLNFSSNYIDSDALTKLLAQAPNTQTTAGPSVNAVIKNGKGKIAKLKSGTLIAENISFDYTLNKNVFKLTNLAATFCEGKITGEASYNMANTKTSVDGIGKSINVRKAANAFAGANYIILSGTLNAMAKLSFRGTTYKQQISSLNGQIKFDVVNGQYGEAARFERFLHAGNLLTQNLLNFNLNQTLSAVTNKNTGEFKQMEGTISLANGRANITSFRSSGPNMSLYAAGKYNILTETADIKVLGRISSSIVSVLGPLGSFSLDKMLDKLPAKGLAVVEVVKTLNPTSSLFAEISKADLAKIPPLSTNSYNAASKDFQVLINGPVSKTTSVKSFKWAQKETPVANSSAN